MKIARLLAGITLLGWASLSAADSAPVPFIIGGDEVIEPSSVETSAELMLPDDPSLPALDEPIAMSSDMGEADMLDLGLLEDELIFEEPSEISEPMPMAVEDDSSLPFMLDELDDEMGATPSMDDILGGPEEVVADVVEAQEEPATIILTPEMAVLPEEDIVDNSVADDMAPMFDDLDAVVLEDDMLEPVEPIVEQPQMDVAEEVEPMMISLDRVEGDPVGIKTVEGPQEEWGSSFEVSMAPKRVIGPDGSEHVEGLEHIIGRSNPVLQEVKGVRRTIAEVGQGFPALHVDNISLTDLLYYLRNFTDQPLENRLANEIYVSMDLQPESLDDVFEYLNENYPVEVVQAPNGGFAIIDSAVLNEGMLANSGANGVGLVDGAIAYDLNGNPIMPGDTLDNLMAQNAAGDPAGPGAAMGSAAGAEGAASLYTDPSMGLVANGVMPGSEMGFAPNGPMMDANGNVITESMWREMQRKAHMYELNKRREDLLAERERIEREIRDYHLARRTD